MNEPRHGTTVSGEVIPPQTYLHKVAPAPADEGDEETTPVAAEDTSGTADETDVPDGTDGTDRTDLDDDADAYDDDSDDEEDTDEDTAAMPTATTAPDTAMPDTPVVDTPAVDTPVVDTPVVDTAVPDATVPDTPVPDTPDATTSVASEPREGRPGDVPVPEYASLLADGSGIREQWMQVQASFVDDPRAAVGAAAGVITDAVTQVETAVRQRQQALRERWDGEGQTDTEALRVTMQQYRQLLERLAEL